MGKQRKHFKAVSSGAVNPFLDAEVVAPAEDKVVAPKSAEVVAPNKEVVAPKTAEVVAPRPSKVVAPVEDKVVAPVEDKVVAPYPSKVVAPVEDEVVAPESAEVVAPAEDKVVAPTETEEASPTQPEPRVMGRAELSEEARRAEMDVSERMAHSAEMNIDGFTDWSVCKVLGWKRRTLIAVRKHLLRGVDWTTVNGEVAMTASWCASRQLCLEQLVPAGRAGLTSVEVEGYALNPQLILAKRISDGVTFPVRVLESSAFKRGMIIEARMGYNEIMEIAYAWPRRDY